MKRICIVQMAGSPCVRMRKVARSFAEQDVTYLGCNRGAGSAVIIEGVKLDIVGPKIGSKSISKLFLAPFWAFNAARKLRAERYDMVYAADLEAGVAAYLGGKSYIYDVLDTYADRYRVPAIIRALIRAVESYIFRKATLRVHVAEYRHATLRSNNCGRASTFTIPNTPMARDLPAISSGRRFDVIATGNIDKNRGCDALLAASEALGISVCLVGKISTELYERFRHVKNFTFFSYRPAAESLALCAESRAIYCAYDPASRINILAAPNKIYDAIFCGTPLLINEEILISRELKDLGIASTFVWGDNLSLTRALREISSDQWSSRIRIAQELSSKTPTWEVAFRPVTEWISKGDSI